MKRVGAFLILLALGLILFSGCKEEEAEAEGTGIDIRFAVRDTYVAVYERNGEIVFDTIFYSRPFEVSGMGLILLSVDDTYIGGTTPNETQFFEVSPGQHTIVAWSNSVIESDGLRYGWLPRDFSVSENRTTDILFFFDDTIHFSDTLAQTGP